MTIEDLFKIRNRGAHSVVGMRDVSTASDLLKPYDARLMRCYPVSTRINHVANDDAECSRPTETPKVQERLFS